MNGRFESFRTVYPDFVGMGSVPSITWWICKSIRDTGVPASLHCTGSYRRWRRPWMHYPLALLPDAVRFRLIGNEKLRVLTQRQYLSSVRSGDVAFLIPSTHDWVYEELRRRGVTIAVEFVNTHRRFARETLGRAYEHAGVVNRTPVTDRDIADDDRRVAMSDICFCPSPMVRRSLEAGGVPEHKIVDTSYGWGADATAISAARAIVRPRDGRLTFLACGWLSIRKGMHLLLRAWADAGIDGRLVIAGRMDDEVRPLCKDVLNRKDVTLLGYVDDLDPVYRQADVFVMPSLEEGSPLVTFEAMAMGLPSIVSPMGGGRSAEGGKGVIVIDPYDHEGFVAALRRMASDSELRMTLGREAAEEALRFTWDNVGIQRRAAIEAWLAARGTAQHPLEPTRPVVDRLSI